MCVCTYERKNKTKKEEKKIEKTEMEIEIERKGNTHHITRILNSAKEKSHLKITTRTTQH